MATRPAYLFVISLCILKCAQAASTTGLSVSTREITVIINQDETFDIFSQVESGRDFDVLLVTEHEGLVELRPANFSIRAGSAVNQNVTIHGLRPGSLEISATSQPEDPNIVKDLFVRVVVAHSRIIYDISLICGWVYFLAWSVSFYPQIHTNFRRKSVVGLNFDFIVLNIVGFGLYSAFNCGLYWVPEIQAEYANRHPRGLNPVKLNDVVFSLHAFVISIVTFGQCYMYERGGQRVSKISYGLLGVFAIVIASSIGLASMSKLHWLDTLYTCSYVKLMITIIKYVPQALMNYRRKSTSGWSIGNILLDFTGGILSMLQMIIDAYNYDDWRSIFGDPTKFGLGLFSVLFDIFFILQHYVFYRHSRENSASSLTPTM